MSNLGLGTPSREPRPDARAHRGRRPLCDRADASRRADNVGGEQSGRHASSTDYSTTGDGLVAALQVLAVVHKRGRSVERGLPSLRAAARRCFATSASTAACRSKIRPSPRRSPRRRRGSAIGDGSSSGPAGNRTGDPRHGRGRRQSASRQAGRRCLRGGRRHRLSSGSLFSHANRLRSARAPGSPPALLRRRSWPTSKPSSTRRWPRSAARAPSPPPSPMRPRAGPR